MLSRKFRTWINKIYHRMKRRLPPVIRGHLLKLEPVYGYLRFRFRGTIPQPCEIIIDPTNICNLKCPLCPTGLKKLDFSKCVMDFAAFKSIIDEVIVSFPFLATVSLFSWGEPFLNPDIFKMIMYLKKKGFFVFIDTHLSFKIDTNFHHTLVQSGLDVLNVSLDGASEKTYAAYRRGGEFKLVISNLKSLLETRRRLNKRTPEIVWKFVVNKYNEHEIPLARQKARELDIQCETVQIGLGDAIPDVQFDESLYARKEKWLPMQEKYINKCYLPGFTGPLFKEIIPFCSFLFKTLVITPHGKVVPCPLVASEKNVFGDVHKESIKSIWKNEYFSYSRNLFKRKRKHIDGQETLCSTCRNFTY